MTGIVKIMFYGFFCIYIYIFFLKNNSTRTDINNDIYYEIPFEYYLNEIIIKVDINGKEYRFLFDTGGYTMIIDDVLKDHNFKVVDLKKLNSNP